MPNADHLGIFIASYPLEIPLYTCISIEEILPFMNMLHPFKAAVCQGIPFFTIKFLRSLLVSLINPLFLACINFSYYPIAFCHCNTVLLRKLSKGNNSVSAAWQPMVLINTLGKVLESIKTYKTSSLSKEHSLLPAQYVGAYPGRSINTGLNSVNP
jgi:hypothetical protein